MGFKQKLAKAKKELAAVKKELATLKKLMSLPEDSLPAQLLHLRVVPESVEDRTGFMVSAFVPSGALKRLRSSPQFMQLAFRDKVATMLVDRAIAGMLRLTKSGKMVAVVFEPLGSDKSIITPVFETEDGKHVAKPLPSSDLTIRMIREREHAAKVAQIEGAQNRKALTSGDEDGIVEI